MLAGQFRKSPAFPILVGLLVGVFCLEFTLSLTSKNDGSEIDTLEGPRDPETRTLPRRKILSALAIAGTVPALQADGNQSDDNETGGDDEVETHFEFGGEVDGWQGRSPSEIEGETNPALDLEPGGEYWVTWENLDGVEPDFVILDANGNEITGTEITAEQGETLSLTLTASEEMDQYVCTIHPNRVSGRIQAGDEGPTDDAPTEDEEDVETHFELVGEVDGWQGQSPSEIEGETNPTLELEEGDRYRVTWENGDSVQHNFTILDSDGIQITSTEITTVEGETLSLTFTATDEMAQYYCAIHTDGMRGDIQIGEEESTDDESTEVEEDVETRFELGGAIGGWQGRLPEERDHEDYIEGEENPTLELEAGSRYMVTWENVDGVTHDFTIRDADENGLMATEVASNQGERRSLTFTASEEMDHYVCTFHLDTMRGEIQISGDGGDVDVEEPFPPSPAQMVGGMAVSAGGFVLGLAYVLSKYFDDSHEP